MKGNQDIIKALNETLTRELTAINQYFLHARMLEDWGLDKIGKLEYKASIDAMKHADLIIKRILFLEGLPNLQKLGKLNIGQNTVEILNSDLEVESKSAALFKECIELAEKEQDFVTRDLLSSLLESCEEHIDWLETQESLVKEIGIQKYMQSQIKM
ncbi:MAG: bacterioferritin [Thermoproteota archaeon]|jgi:bacterioferritin